MDFVFWYVIYFGICVIWHFNVGLDLFDEFERGLAIVNRVLYCIMFIPWLIFIALARFKQLGLSNQEALYVFGSMYLLSMIVGVMIGWMSIKCSENDRIIN